ncbi:MAG: hypothetical protein KGD65_15120, partial [Candidatus Lokiarchaeota archaeon]|nr:hypothetical protein [Candidatus Lokiarchaeota archaeon]
MELVDILHGSFSLLYVIISFSLGLIILFKYFKFKNRLYVLVGLTWIFLSFPWLPDSISFLLNVFVQTSLASEWYFIIGNIFIPIALISWIIAYTDMINRDKQKLTVSIILIFSLVFEIIFFTLFFMDVDLIGLIDPLRPFSADLGALLIVFLLITMLIMLITGVKFSLKSIQSEDKEIRLKGKLLRVAFIAFTIAALLEKTARSIMLGVVFQDPT